MEQTHFSKSPITEAIIDLRVTSNEGVTAADLARMSSIIAEHYPEKQELHAGQVHFQLSDNPTADASRQQVGLRYASADKREILQARIDGFTFSVLRPYERWETFSGEAHRLWDVYREVMQPKAITRLGVRYINKIDIPKPSIELRDYFRTFPEISSDAPNEILNYFMQLSLSGPKFGGIVVINQTIVPSPESDMVSVVLDLDLSRDASRTEEEIPQNEDDIWRCFEQLRISKNAIFKACITERTKEMIR
jgi:uncharacterized protein (TIGR04255 family)